MSRRLTVRTCLSAGLAGVLVVSWGGGCAADPFPPGNDPDTLRAFVTGKPYPFEFLEEAGTISGTVVDADGNPVPNVLVNAFVGDSDLIGACTDTNGQYVLGQIPAGSYRLECTVIADELTDQRSTATLPATSKADARRSLLQAAPSGPANVALNATVEVHGAFFATPYLPGPSADVQTAVDGAFLPRHTSWQQGTVWWYLLGGFQTGQFLTVNLGASYTIESFVIQVHSKEAYVLSYWDLEQQAWNVCWQIPKGDTLEWGMETRPDPSDGSVRYVLPNPIVTNSLMLSGAANTGPHLYSVSEIQAFGRASNSPPVANAGGPYAAQATGWNGAEVRLDGGASQDPNGDALAYVWTIGEEQIGTAPEVDRQFPIGQTVVSLTVIDTQGAADTASTTVTVTAIEANLDIRPGDDSNTINLSSKGAVPVAVLTGDGFDAATIDPATLTFQGYEFLGFVRMSGASDQKPIASLADVDGDGDLDLLVHLETANLPLTGTETHCTLGALTYDGLLVRGTDNVRLITK